MTNTKRSEAARKAAETRWGPLRVVRMDELTPKQRQLVLALIEAQKEANRQREGKEKSGE